MSNRPAGLILARELHEDELQYAGNITQVSSDVGKRLASCCKSLFNSEIRPNIPHKVQGSTLAKYQNQLEFIIMNLYRGWSVGPKQKVCMPTSNDAYTPNTALGKRRMSADVSRNIMSGLEQAGYIVSHGKRAYKSKSYGGYRSTGNRWSATPKLIELLGWEYELLPEMFKHGPAARRTTHVRQRKKKNHIAQDEYTSTRREHDRKLRAINALLWKTPALLDVESLESASEEIICEANEMPAYMFDRTRATLYRIYTSNLTHGGRYYGHRVQSWPKEIRNGYLLIGEHKTFGWDFTSCHIDMAFALAGHKMPEDFDPYVWPGCPVPRKVMKRLLVAAMNGKSRTGSAKAIHSTVCGMCFPLPVLVAALDDAIDRLPKDVHEYFFNDFGLKAMWYESEIAFRVMSRMAESGLPVIPLHDGFLCQEPFKEQLRECMIDASAEVLGRPLTVTQG